MTYLFLRGDDTLKSAAIPTRAVTVLSGQLSKGERRIACAVKEGVPLLIRERLPRCVDVKAEVLGERAENSHLLCIRLSPQGDCAIGDRKRFVWHNERGGNPFLGA